MVSTAAIWILAIVVLVLFFWIVFRVDGDTCGDTCGDVYGSLGSCRPGIGGSVTPPPSNVLPQPCKITVASLAKFGQLEHEIDTLTRSYIIERLCSCYDACNTLARIDNLCDRLGSNIGLCYGFETGLEYARLRKELCHYVCAYLDSSSPIAPPEWERTNASLVETITRSNPHASRDFLLSCRRDHADLIVQMIQAHTESNSLASMVIYDAITEKTDAYIDRISASTLRYKQ